MANGDNIRITHDVGGGTLEVRAIEGDKPYSDPHYQIETQKLGEPPKVMDLTREQAQLVSNALNLLGCPPVWGRIDK